MFHQVFRDGRSTQCPKSDKSINTHLKLNYSLKFLIQVKKKKGGGVF